MPISYFSLFASLETGVENWRVQNYNIYYRIGNPIKLEILNTKGIKTMTKVFDFYLSGRNLIRADSLGWGPKNEGVNIEELQISGMEAAGRQTEENFNLLSFQAKNVKKIIQIARRNKWKVILVTPPAYNSYVANLNKKQLDLTISHLEKLDQDFDNVFYFNFLQTNSFTPTDFYDADHLNQIGANKFSRILNKKISTEIP